MIYTVFKSVYFAYFIFTMTYDVIFLRNSINNKTYFTSKRGSFGIWWH